MPRESILMPVFALVLLTFVVWNAMYVSRIRFMKKNRVDPQRVDTRSRAVVELQPVAGPADNLQNLFELPVLFYVFTLLLFVLDRVDGAYLAGAWAFVGLRYVHSFVHCTYNRVMHRFLVYVSGAVVVWVMWARLALQML